MSIVRLSAGKKVDIRLRDGPNDVSAGLADANRQADQKPLDRHGPVVVCRSCRQMLTTASARIAIGGSHEHTFDNPHGIRFNIGCFAWASNCAVVTPPSRYWSWFPGHAWQVEICSNCSEHLGWLFGSADTMFHGFILDRLIEIEENTA